MRSDDSDTMAVLDSAGGSVPGVAQAPSHSAAEVIIAAVPTHRLMGR
jgi:hypothetical protein